MKKPIKLIKLRIKICSPFDRNDTVEASVQILYDVDYNQYGLYRKGDKSKVYFTIYNYNYMDIALEGLYDSGFTKEEIDKCFNGDPKYTLIRESIIKGMQKERDERISELVSNFLADQFDYKTKRFKSLEG